MIQVMLLEPALATRDRWGEDSAHCAHAQCLEQCTREWYPEVGVRAVFEDSATHRTGNTSSQEDVSSDESITDLTEDRDSGGYDHTNSRRSPCPVYVLTRSKNTYQLPGSSQEPGSGQVEVRWSPPRWELQSVHQRQMSAYK